ncbi:helix-turn-helix transcriptional regulator [Microbulbifer hainanensis]|uniref:helix-turn-helix transcriptional regulator n=1 Tax=Microbulbifer hainanensis TaxID=2735675 RepID=UPI001868D442|nr:LuxR C-terminal-related transcriptional regulator [Microbulbifer hainanensis]
MPILFFSNSGLHGDLLYSLISDALSFDWEKAEISKQRHCLQHYQAIVIDCWQISINLEPGNLLNQLKNLHHPKILLINYPPDLPAHVADQLKQQKLRLVCDASANQEHLIRKLGAALQNAERDANDKLTNGLLLTRREQEILSELTSGEPNSVIASRLHLSEHTVKNHMYNIFRKIGVKNRLQASNWAKLHLQAERI